MLQSCYNNFLSLKNCYNHFKNVCRVSAINKKPPAETLQAGYTHSKTTGLSINSVFTTTKGKDGLSFPGGFSPGFGPSNVVSK